MKAWILENQAPIENNPLVLKELTDPHPGADEIRIRNIACGVCRTDIHDFYHQVSLFLVSYLVMVSNSYSKLVKIICIMHICALYL